MRHSLLYEQDFYAWANDQAALLRTGRVSDLGLCRRYPGGCPGNRPRPGGFPARLPLAVRSGEQRRFLAGRGRLNTPSGRGRCRPKDQNGLRVPVMAGPWPRALVPGLVPAMTGERISVPPADSFIVGRRQRTGELHKAVMPSPGPATRRGSRGSCFVNASRVFLQLCETLPALRQHRPGKSDCPGARGTLVFPGILNNPERILFRGSRLCRGNSDERFTSRANWRSISRAANCGRDAFPCRLVAAPSASSRFWFGRPANSSRKTT